jgi:YidC/Oxa1 family membrane protein insertase
MAMNSRMAVKQQALKKKYEKDVKKYNEEVARLYEREGINPMSGCFVTMVLPLVLWSGVYGAITKPLQNTLHIAAEKVVQAVEVLRAVPELSGKIGGGYEQLQIVRHFSQVKDYLTMFSSSELKNIEEYSSGFNFMGLNLLNRPNAAPLSEMLWLIPLFCFLSSVLVMYLGQKMTGTQSQAQGCMKYMPYTLLVFTAYISYTIPAAVGLYWIINALFGAVQSVVLNKYYNIFTMNAKDEAARLARLNIQEASVERIKDIDQ